MGKRDRTGAYTKEETIKRSKACAEERAEETTEERSSYIEHKKVRAMSSEEVQRLREEMSELLSCAP